MACIAGGVAEAFDGGVPAEVAARAMGCLDAGPRAVCRRFFQAHHPANLAFCGDAAA